MDILWWLVPPVVVTALAMLWVTWLGRSGRGEVDRDVAVERLARALRKEHPATHAAEPGDLPPPRPQHRHRRTPVLPPVHRARRGEALPDGRPALGLSRSGSACRRMRGLAA